MTQDQHESPSDKVRSYCRDQIIVPARRNSITTVTIRSGDIHGELGFKNRLPLVCSALGSKKFEEMARVSRISIEGPANGANTKYTFQLRP